MKILIAGAEGQLAREIIIAASAMGIDVVSPPETDFDIADFRKVSDFISSVKPNIVFNCAAYNDVDRAETDWQTAFMVNGIGVKHLAMACKRHNSVLVHYGTDYVFDGDAERPYTIADLPNPISSYGQSKRLGEELIREHGALYFIIRTSWLFGKGRNSFPLKLLQWAASTDSLKIVDDQTASPTYCRDLAAVSLKLVQTENFGLYHITNTGYASRYEWAKLILSKTKWQGRLIRAKSDDFNTPARRPAFSVLDNFPIEQTIGSLLPTWQDATERFLKEVI